MTDLKLNFIKDFQYHRKVNHLAIFQVLGEIFTLTKYERNKKTLFMLMIFSNELTLEGFIEEIPEIENDIFKINVIDNMVCIVSPYSPDKSNSNSFSFAKFFKIENDSFTLIFALSLEKALKKFLL